jgi:tetratricopeptide (TPR) repeat protein
LADAAPAMALAFQDGRALLTIAPRDLGSVRVERLEIDFPASTDRPSVAGDLQNRRGQLREAQLVIDRAGLAQRADEAQRPLGRAAELEVSLGHGEIVLSDRAEAGPAARPPAKLTLGPGRGRRVRISVDGDGAEVATIRAILSATLGPAQDGEPGIEIDPLEWALDELLVAEGFRLPDSAGLRLRTAAISPEQIALSWSSEAPDEIGALCRALDAAAPGEARAEVAHRLAAAYERAGQEQDAVTALRLCLEHAVAGPLVGPAWRRLVEIYARRGDPHAAARALIAAADDPRAGASDVERAGELVAAAEILRKRLNLPGDAGMLLERALSLDPGSAEALGALEALTADAGDFARLAEVLERKLERIARGPLEQKAILGRLVEIYAGRLARPELASQASARLAQIDPPAPAARPPAATLAELGVVDVAAGAPARAENAYWRAAGIEAEPALRANYLISHARVLLARGDVLGAVGQIEEALRQAPTHLAALALLADVSFRKQDWSRARELYAAVERSSDAADVMPRELLVHRRAALAHRMGDAVEAESLYRELAILSPHHVDARRALAELALARGDTATAAQRLEEVLRLLPAGASAELGELRHRLGAVYAETGELASARYYLELVAAQDPTRAPALELLLETYEKLGLYREAAETCARLGRLYLEPAHRAAALYRQAEILRTHLDDPIGALDAYLRSSDIDPAFVPSRLRLVDHFWAEGDVDVVADLANDLSAVPLSPVDDADLVARLAIATAGPRHAGPPRFALAAHPHLAEAAARVLALAGDRAAARGVDTIDPLLAHARFWAGAEGDGWLVGALLELVLADPARPGPACALGALAARTRRFALARAAFSLPAFVDPEGLGNKLLEGLAPLEQVRSEVVRVGSAVDHPDVSGPARRALARLAPALLGLGTDQPAPKPIEGSGLQPARATELRRIAELLHAPPFVVAPDAEVAGKPLALQSERRRLRLIPSQPAGLLISPSAARLGPQAWSFVAGRALEALRSGLVTAGLTNAEGMARLFDGARASLDNSRVDDPRARAVADWLVRPEAILLLGTVEARAELLVDVEAALEAMPDWQTFRRGTRHTCNRVGLLVCGSPLSALSVISEGELYGDDGEPPSTETRREFLRGASARETIQFMLSPIYEAACTT